MDTRPAPPAGFHPASAAAYFAVLVVAAVAGGEPLPLLLFLGASLAVIAARPGGLRFALRMGLAFVPLAVFVVLANIVLAPPGPTLLFNIPDRLPFIGGHPVTLETARFGLVMALRVLTILAVFLAWDRTVDTDRNFLYLARRVPATALTLLLALRLLPVMRNDFFAVCEAHRVRGLPFDGSSLRRWRSYAVVLRGLLILALERGLEIAEAMHARGFAGGRRSCTVQYPWRPRDTFLAAGAAALLLGGAAGGWGTAPLVTGYTAAGLLLTAAGAFILPLREWGCRLWPCWRHAA